jgi:S1-C subfamily serine protease
MSGKNGSLGKRDGLAEANLLYQVNLLRLRESRYVPEGLDKVRGSVLSGASWLRSNGFTSLAADLEMQLQKAGQAQSAVQEPPRSETGPAISRGTAFVVRPDGTLLSAFHVVQDAKNITVTCPDGPPIPGTVETMASTNDLAVLRISRPTPSFLSLARPRSVRTGDAVFTIGFPATTILGSEPKFTDGSVSALSGPAGEATLLQITVPVQPGNSGGALLNNEGQVVGIVTSSAAIRPFITATGTLPQNINWAVKADYALPLFEQPAIQPLAASRTDAIDRGTKATCQIEAHGASAP